jgi:hypothetical protein
MSKAPVMVDCPKCRVVKYRGSGSTTGLVNRVMIYNKFLETITFEDICDRCGGSGRVAL